ncbi:MAG: hypothetical protein WBP40_01460 [Candidatus Moraniibacteriota bacterium]|nr:MAG: hypothetical protein IPJ68_00520 [Candidatus Moranbacteria bacterium]
MKKKLKKVTTIEDLATLMQGEFLVIHEKMDSGFQRVDERLDEMQQEMRELKRDVEDLKLRMVEVAYRFEVRELEKRIHKLELRLAK